MAPSRAASCISRHACTHQRCCNALMAAHCTECCAAPQLALTPGGAHCCIWCAADEATTPPVSSATLLEIVALQKCIDECGVDRSLMAQPGLGSVVRILEAARAIQWSAHRAAVARPLVVAQGTFLCSCDAHTQLHTAASSSMLLSCSSCCCNAGLVCIGRALGVQQACGCVICCTLQQTKKIVPWSATGQVLATGTGPCDVHDRRRGCGGGSVPFQ